MRPLRYLLAPLALAVLPALGAPASAQSVVDVRATCDTAGIPGCQALARSVFRVDDSGAIVANGELGVGIHPSSGEGYKLFWDPFHAAFRAGGTDDNAGGTQWDAANVGFYSWAGGNLTVARSYATFAFGDQALANSNYAVSFGNDTIVDGTAGFGMGEDGYCAGFTCVAIGFNATADGQGAVAIGYRTTADADYAVAIGHRASANGHAGAFVIADQATTDSLEASANNQFSSRYSGGYRLYTNATTTTGVSLNAGGSSWNVISDRDAKEAFEPLDAEALLQRLAQLPLSTWRYRDAGTEERHIGPMAQDWQALVDGPLGLNGDDVTINQGDFDGVNLAGVVALEARTRALAAENDALRGEVDALRAEVDALRADRVADAARFARLEAALARLAPEAPGGVTTASATTEEPRP